MSKALDLYRVPDSSRLHSEVYRVELESGDFVVMEVMVLPKGFTLSYPVLRRPSSAEVLEMVHELGVEGGGE